MSIIFTAVHFIAVCALALWLTYEILENAKLRAKNAKLKTALKDTKEYCCCFVPNEIAKNELEGE